MYDNIETQAIKDALADRYIAAEIVDLLDLTADEIIDILQDKIFKNLKLFDLIDRDFTLEYHTGEEDDI
jgi:hypothetical protein